MTTSRVSPGDRIRRVRISASRISVDLEDGRTVSVPLAWFPRLLHATPAERRNWELCGAGRGIHWPALDEDLSVDGFLRGTPAPGGSVTARRP